MSRKTKTIENEFAQIVNEANPYLGREGLVYVRVSSKRQEKEGHGREGQEERCKQDLRSIGVQFTKTFPDTFTGAGDFMKRPAMREMFNYIDAHPHRKFVVVFDDLKRLARDVSAHFKLRAAFKIRDVKLRCLNYNFDESEEGEFVELVFAGQAQLERKQNRRQVIQKMKARMERGYWAFTGKRSYDMPKDPIHGKLLVPNKDGKLLKKMLEDFASGNLIRKVDAARFLFSKGFWKNRKRLAEDYIDEVSAILRDITHCGDIEYLPWGVTRRKGMHKGIISYDTFDKIQKRLKKEETGARIRVDLSAEFPLRGLITCSDCGEKLTAAPCKGRPKKYFYYYCVNKKCKLYSKMLPRDSVERDFRILLENNRLKSDMDEIVQLTFDRVWKGEVYNVKQQEIQKGKYKQELQEKIRDFTELVRVTRSETLKRTYESQIEEVAKELEKVEGSGQNRDLRVPYRTAMTKVVSLLKNPVTIWQNVDVVEKHKLFFFLFEKRIAYTKGEGFRTAKELSTIRIFEEFCDENSDDVESDK